MTPIVSEVFLRTQSDERLVTLARRGHHQAFVAIVARYERELLAFARRCGPEARAEDVVQQALLNAFVALRNGTEVGHLRGWLYAIVRRASARAAAQTQVADGDLDAAQTEPLEDEVLRRAQARETLAAVSGLPERQRDALLATVFKGASRSDIARDLGQSEGVVRQLVHRARVNVRSAVGALVPLPGLRWLSALRGDSPVGGAGADASASAAVVASTSLAAKLGVLLASGVVATGAVVLPDRSSGHRQHRTGAAHERAAAAPAPGGAVAAAVAVGSGPRVDVTRTVSRAGSNFGEGGRSHRSSRGSASASAGHRRGRGPSAGGGSAGSSRSGSGGATTGSSSGPGDGGSGETSGTDGSRGSGDSRGPGGGPGSSGGGSGSSGGGSGSSGGGSGSSGGGSGSSGGGSGSSGGGPGPSGPVAVVAATGGSDGVSGSGSSSDGGGSGSSGSGGSGGSSDGASGSSDGGSGSGAVDGSPG